MGDSDQYKPQSFVRNRIFVKCEVSAQETNITIRRNINCQPIPACACLDRDHLILLFRIPYVCCIRLFTTIGANCGAKMSRVGVRASVKTEARIRQLKDINRESSPYFRILASVFTLERTPTRLILVPQFSSDGCK